MSEQDYPYVQTEDEDRRDRTTKRWLALQISLPALMAVFGLVLAYSGAHTHSAYSTLSLFFQSSAELEKSTLAYTPDVRKPFDTDEGSAVSTVPPVDTSAVFLLQDVVVRAFDSNRQSLSEGIVELGWIPYPEFIEHYTYLYPINLTVHIDKTGSNHRIEFQTRSGNAKADEYILDHVKRWAYHHRETSDNKILIVVKIRSYFTNEQ